MDLRSNRISCRYLLLKGIKFLNKLSRSQKFLIMKGITECNFKLKKLLRGMRGISSPPIKRVVVCYSMDSWRISCLVRLDAVEFQPNVTLPTVLPVNWINTESSGGDSRLQLFGSPMASFRSAFRSTSHETSDEGPPHNHDFQLNGKW